MGVPRSPERDSELADHQRCRAADTLELVHDRLSERHVEEARLHPTYNSSGGRFRCQFVRKALASDSSGRSDTANVLNATSF
jgi:hypothetical protein